MLEINKIYNENCLDTMSRMSTDFVDITFTSPPYNRKRNDKYAFYCDTLVDYYGFLRTTIEESIRVSKDNVFFNIQKNYYNKEDVFRIIGDFSKIICEVFVWEKSNPMPAAGFNITNAYEFIIVFGKSIKSNRTYTKNHLTTSVAKMHKSHKAMMHEEVARFFIENFTNEGDLIYDPFMGSGTTAKVALDNNRNYIGSEISEEYCEIAEKRIDESLKST